MKRLWTPKRDFTQRAPAYVYDLLNDELKFGKIVQAEQ